MTGTIRPRSSTIGRKTAFARGFRIVSAAMIVSGGAVMGLSVSAYGASPTDAPHIMVIMMENESETELLGSPDAPNVNALAAEYGLATESYSVDHPSLPNYLELLSGSTYGVSDDGTPSSDPISSSAQTLVNQLETAGISWKAYMESMPSAGYTGGDTTSGGGQYYQHHDPFVYFPSITSLPDFDSNLVPSTNIMSDLSSSTPPDFVWMTPNGTDDMHDGQTNAAGDVDPSVGDAWLGNFVSQVQDTSWYAQGGNILVEWDEGVDSDTSGVGTASVGGGHIITLDISAALKADPQQDSTPVNTAGILHSIEDAYGLPYLADAADASNGNIDSLLDATAPTTPSTATTAAPPPTTTPATTPPTSTPPPTTSPATTPATTTPSTATTPTTSTTPATTPATTTPSTATTPTTSTTPATTTPTRDSETSTTATPVAGTSADFSVSAGRSSGPPEDQSVVSAKSSALAFTGSGPGVRTLGILGAGLVVLGIALMALVGMPRRRAAQPDTQRADDLWLVTRS